MTYRLKLIQCLVLISTIFLAAGCKTNDVQTTPSTELACRVIGNLARRNLTDVEIEHLLRQTKVDIASVKLYYRKNCIVP